MKKQRPFTKQQRDLICMIYDISTGSTTINSLPHIAKLANQLLTEDVYARPKQEHGDTVVFKDKNDNIRMTIDASAPIVMTPHPSFAQQRTAEQSSRTLAWVGLTDDDRNVISRHHAYVDNIIKATEAKLKEKNT